jgi:hypothetical protein
MEIIYANNRLHSLGAYLLSIQLQFSPVGYTGSRSGLQIIAEYKDTTARCMILF